jgi:hypothetical protein
MHDATTILFGLPGVAVRSVERVAATRVVHLVTTERTAAACPKCGVFSTTVCEHRTRPRDISYGEQPIRLRRAASATVEAGASVATAVREHHVSWPIVHAAYVARADAALGEPDPVAVLGVDETRRGRPRWRKDPDTGGWVNLECFETDFVDLGGIRAARADRGWTKAGRHRLARRPRRRVKEAGGRGGDGPVRGLPLGGASRAAERDDRR